MPDLPEYVTLPEAGKQRLGNHMNIASILRDLVDKIATTLNPLAGITLVKKIVLNLEGAMLLSIEYRRHESGNFAAFKISGAEYSASFRMTETEFREFAMKMGAFPFGAIPEANNRTARVVLLNSISVDMCDDHSLVVEHFYNEFQHLAYAQITVNWPTHWEKFSMRNSEFCRFASAMDRFSTQASCTDAS